MNKFLCKVNYAFIVNKIMPELFKDYKKNIFDFLFKYQFIVKLSLAKLFDFQQILGIINITYFCFGGKNYVKRFQIQFFKRAGYFKCEGSQSLRSAFSKLRLFRSKGSYSSKIRNDSPCKKGRCTYFPGNKKLWCFQAFLLQGSGGISSGGNYRFNSQEKGTQGSAQINIRSHGFCRKYFRAKQKNNFHYFGKCCKRAIWFYHSFTKYRKSSGKTQKKTVSQELVIKLDKESFIEYYEKLRFEVLNNHPSSALGLVLFLRKGIIHWMEAYSNCFDSFTEKRKFPINNDSIVPNRELTSLLAMMAIFAGKEAIKNG